MKVFFIAFGLALLSIVSQAETVTNCVRTGNTVNCTSDSREAVNTPPSYRRLGGKAWCLVSNGPIKKYFCSYDSYDGCMIAANIDNLNGPVSSCIQNTGYRPSQSQDSSDGNVGGSDPLKAGWVAYTKGDYQTAAHIFLANENNPQAQLALGLMYGLGQGVPKNLEQAKKWLLRAKRNGVAEANDALKAVEKETQDSFEPNKQHYDQKEGESCSAHSECSGLMKCMNGTCKQPIRVGERCENSDGCEGRAFCKENRCIEEPRYPLKSKKIAEGAACNASFECFGSLVCLQGTCQPMGNQCRDNSNCSGGNICRSGYCVAQ